jgi:uncharacterized protein (TIGR00251 family)
MLLELLVKPNSRQESVEKISDSLYRVAVNAPPIDGKANEAVIRLLAKHFKVPKSAITLVRGAKGKKKWVQIND